MKTIEGGVCAAQGFTAAGVHCGIRKNKTKRDLALIYSSVPASAAAVYTTNLVKGAPLVVTKQHLANGKAQAVICNSGNANTCNANGIEIAEQMSELLAQALQIQSSDVVVASTGVIGQPLDIAPIAAGIPELVKNLGPHSAEAAEGIMTTDTKRKEIAVSFTVGGKECRIGGICKGSGMIHPNMATMLVFITTDCAISRRQSMEREKLKSRLGFILLSAGCAIGIGNVWKFPYMAGQGGGGAFVLFYLLFLVILGLPIMTMEFSVGRASHKSPVRAYQALEKPGQKWHIHGYFTLIGCYLLMMFYTTVAGWMLHYFYMTAAGKLVGLDADQVAGKFTEMLASPLTMGFWMVVVVAIGIFVCARGLQNGLEKVTKVMMIALLVIMVVLAVNSMFMPGAKEGLTFFLVPDFERMKEVGIVNTLVGAMNQAFFTLSLGIGAMAIFGSYIGKEHALLGESVRVVVLDTFVAITAGLIIFPACFTYGVDQTSGPSLIFITLPNIFANMAMGRLWGSLFFLFMAFAALSTVLAVFENIICCGMELTGWNRQKSSLVNFFLIIALSLPCVLGYNVWAWDGFAIFGGAVLDVEDFLVSNLFLPLGSLVYLLFCVTRYGWGWDNYKKEVNTGDGLKMHDWMRGYLTYGLPLIVLFIFVFGLYDKFIA